MDSSMYLWMEKRWYELMNFKDWLCTRWKNWLEKIEAHFYAFITILFSLLIISIVGSCVIAPKAAQNVLLSILEKFLRYILILFNNLISFLHSIPLVGFFIPDINDGNLSGISVNVPGVKISSPEEVMEIFIFTLVVSALTGVFPVTFLAYNYFRKRVQIKRFKEDLKLFGLVTEEQPNPKELEEIYNTYYSPPQFLSFIFLLIGISTTVFAVYYVARTDVAIRTGGTSNSLTALLPLIQIEILFYTFLGAYFFGVQYVIRRYSTSDLQPQVFASIVLRILLSGTIIFVVTALLAVPQSISPAQSSPATSGQQSVEQNSDRPEESLDARSFNLLTWQILAFVIGAFPNQGFRWIMLAASRAFRDPTASQLNERPLRKIFGINAWHEARLEEVGIDDIQNLATADIRKLLLTTRFDTMEIANWIDQAILHMKVGLKVEQYIAFQITTYHELRAVLQRIEAAITETSSPDYQENQYSQNGWQREYQNGQLEEGKLFPKGEEIKFPLRQSAQKSLYQEEYNKLAIALGFLGLAELEGLCDFSNYPNYIHIQEYYQNVDRITRERAEQGTEEIISGIGSGGKVIDLDQSASSRNTQEASNDDQMSRRRRDLREGRNLEKRLLTGHKTIRGLNELGSKWYNLGELEKALSIYNEAINLTSREPKPSQPQDPLLSVVYTNRSHVYLNLAKREQERFQQRFQQLEAKQEELEAKEEELEAKEARVRTGQQERLEVGGGRIGTIQTSAVSTSLEKKRKELEEKRKAVEDGRKELEARRKSVEKNALRLYEKAISDNQYALNLNPYNAEAYNAMALAYMEQRDFLLAQKNLEKAINLDDCLAVAYYNRGTLFNTVAKGAEDFEKAAHDFERAYLLGYRPIALWASWGLALSSQGKYKEAIEKYSKAISLDPENSALSYSRRGLAYMQLGLEEGKGKRP